MILCLLNSLQAFQKVYIAFLFMSRALFIHILDGRLGTKFLYRPFAQTHGYSLLKVCLVVYQIACHRIQLPQNPTPKMAKPRFSVGDDIG